MDCSVTRDDLALISRLPGFPRSSPVPPRVRSQSCPPRLSCRYIDRGLVFEQTCTASPIILPVPSVDQEVDTFELPSSAVPLSPTTLSNEGSIIHFYNSHDHRGNVSHPDRNGQSSLPERERRPKQNRKTSNATTLSEKRSHMTLARTGTSASPPSFARSDAEVGSLDMDPGTTTPFQHAPRVLASLIDTKSLPTLEEMGGTNGLLRSLGTDGRTGLRKWQHSEMGPQIDHGNGSGTGTNDLPQFRATVLDRRRVYGINQIPTRQRKTLLAFVWLAMKDKAQLLLFVVALVTFGLGLGINLGFPPCNHEASSVCGSPRSADYIESAATAISLLVIVALTSLNNWHLDGQLCKLDDRKFERDTKVIRDGNEVSINVKDIMVGDIAFLKPGEVVPCDGVFLDGQNIWCDESCATGQIGAVKKANYEECIIEQSKLKRGEQAKHDCFIVSGTVVLKGEGRYVVTAVGSWSYNRRIAAGLSDHTPITPLQSKCNASAQTTTKLGFTLALLLCIILLVKFFVQLKAHPERSAIRKAIVAFRVLIISLTLIVVANPGNLSLAAPRSLAFAAQSTFKQHFLVRDHSACETTAHTTVICIDQTSVLTQGTMSVVAGSVGAYCKFMEDSFRNEGTQDVNGSTGHPGVSRDFLVEMASLKVVISEPLRAILNEALAVCSMPVEDNSPDANELELVHSKIKAALIRFSADLQQLSHDQVVRSSVKLDHQAAFSDNRKIMRGVVKSAEGKYRLYVVGDSEVISRLCSRHVIVHRPESKPQPRRTNVETAPIDNADEENIARTIGLYSQAMLRTYAVAYREFECWPPSILDSTDGVTYETVTNDLTLISILGILDLPRSHVKDTVAQLRASGVALKMCTSDSIPTASSIATWCGILTDGGIVMEGSAFSQLPREGQREIAPHLQVLACSSSRDKYNLVETLKSLDEVVGVTGSNVDDASVLKHAHVGFALGPMGTETARNASGLVLLGNNCSSIVSAITLGRSVYGSVHKYLQFQIPATITTTLVTFVTAVASPDAHSIFSAVQLLWVGVIMHTLAALAIATDPATPGLLESGPNTKASTLFSPDMSKMILGQSLYQVFIVLFLHFAGPSLLGYYTQKDRSELSTMIFTVFVFCQIFNTVNCRSLTQDKNVFSGLTRNWIFAGIILFQAVAHILIVFFGTTAFRVTSLSGRSWGLSIAFGFMPLPLGFIIRCAPTQPLQNFLVNLHIPPDHTIPLALSEAEQYKRAYNDKKENGGSMDTNDHEVYNTLAMFSLIRGGRIRGSSFVWEGRMRRYDLEEGYVRIRWIFRPNTIMDSGGEERNGLNVLCIDGGGARGLTSLLLISESMNRIQKLENLSKPPKPCEYFDIIAGTGTGAAAACMLGRLELSTGQAIEHYGILVRNVFSERKWTGSRAFKLRKLKQAVKAIVKEATGREHEPMVKPNPGLQDCRTVVFAMSERHLTSGKPTAFRSYQGAANQAPECEIWEAICASMAHPELFKSVNIGVPPLQESFVDGGLACNNPLGHTLAEVKAACPGRYVASVISIGAGHAGTIQIPSPGWLNRFLPTNVITAMKDIATDSERVADEMASRFHGTKDVYFRFNVDKGIQSVGLSEWERLSEVAAHAQAYMRQNEVSRMMDCAIRAIRDRIPLLATRQIDGQIQLVSAEQKITDHCPDPTPIFTGREAHTKQVENCIIVENNARRVCIIHGLGGAGKTQLALKVIERTRERWATLLYIDASSSEAIESILREFARAHNIGEGHEDTIRWLGSRRRWLLVFDNADDPSLEIRQYFPSGSHGSIVITTRLQDMIVLARGPNSDCRISSMGPNEALALLLRVARVQDTPLSDGEKSAATALLEDFGYLALAIVHAGAYIGHSDISFSKYRPLFLAQRQATLEEYARIPIKVDDYRWTVYTTWRLCYDLLGPKAQKLIGLLAFLHYDGITEDIFRLAAISMRSYEPIIPLNDIETEALAFVKGFLGEFLRSEGDWDSMAFLSTINELLSHSLLGHDRITQTYRIHVLVQDWARTIAPQTPEIALECTTALLALSVNDDNSIEARKFRRTLELHINRVLSERQVPIGANYGAAFAVVYSEQGQWSLSEELQARVVSAGKQELGDNNQFTLAAKTNLAMTYWKQGRWSDAEKLEVEVMTEMERKHGLDDPHTLVAKANLAATLRELDRWDEAEKLQIEVLDARTRAHDSRHPDVLTAKANLAATFQKQGRWQEAKSLLVEVASARQDILGKDHPHTLDAQANLAAAYRKQGQWGEAEKLETEVVDVMERVLGNEHPHTLTAKANLAATYRKQGRWHEVQELELEVTDTMGRVFDDHHPHLLNAKSNLAATYRKLSRWGEAERLQLEVIGAMEQTLGDKHMHTLDAKSSLAITLRKQGRLDEAELLQAEILEAMQKALGESHPDLLTAKANLSSTFQKQGRWNEAEKLQEEVLNTREQKLGGDHPDTIMAKANLAVTFWNQGHLDEAQRLQLDVVNRSKRVLGANHPHVLQHEKTLIGMSKSAPPLKHV